MKRLRQIFLLSATLISAILFFAFTTLWIRSYCRGDNLVYHKQTNSSVAPDEGYFVASGRGGINFAEFQAPVPTVSPPSGWRHYVNNQPTYPWVEEDSGFYNGNVDRFDRHGMAGFQLAIVEINNWGAKSRLKSWTFPVPVLALLTAILPTLRFIARRRRIKVPPNACTNCGYDLRATPSRCPECGTLPAE